MISSGSKVELCTQALVRINAPTISSFEDKTRESSICGIMYEDVYLRALTSNRWSFTRSYAVLSHDASYNPGAGGSVWGFRFLIPSDCIMLSGVILNNVSDAVTIHNAVSFGSATKTNGYCIDYELRDNHIYCNHSSIIVDYQYRLPEDQLIRCPLFRDYLINLLASEFATALLNDIQKAQFFRIKAEDSFYLASSSDSSQNPTENTSSSETIVSMNSYGG